MNRDLAVVVKTKIKWNGSMLSQQMLAQIQASLFKAAMVLRAAIVRKIRKFSYHKVGPSAPGHAPHMRTGILSGRHIFWRVKPGNPYAVEIGTSVLYGVWLELGTSKMAARPYIRPAFVEQFPRILRIVSGGR